MYMYTTLCIYYTLYVFVIIKLICMLFILLYHVYSIACSSSQRTSSLWTTSYPEPGVGSWSGLTLSLLALSVTLRKVGVCVLYL